MIQKFVEIRSKKVGQASFIASTATSDRYDDIIDQDSWRLEAFKNNPVILLNHRQDMLPIGRASNVEVVNGQLEIDVEFDLDDELGANVARKVDQGFLKAVSVGFQPRKGTMRSDLPSDHKAFGKSGMFYQENELLEVSIVTIPANSEAVAKGFSSGIEDMIRRMVRSELLSKPAADLQKVKHVLEVIEETDRFIVHFAKHEMEEMIDEEPMEPMEEIEDGYKEEEDKSGHDEEEDKSGHDEDEMKHLIHYLLS